jgi:hemerythrin
MTVFTWSDEYSVQVTEMDDQHKVLFDLINQLHQAMMNGKGNDTLAPVLHGLKEYALSHFTAEEKYMDMIRFSGLAEQKKEHQGFILKVEEYERQLTEGKLGLSINVLTFLRDWLIQHIRVSDKKYAEAFHHHGIR